jgi:PAS domain S-box-containing protein
MKSNKPTPARAQAQSRPVRPTGVSGPGQITRQGLPRGDHFRTLIEKSTDVIALLGADGTVLYESPAATRALGYTPAERIGQKSFDLFHPEDATPAREAFAQLSATPRATASMVLRCRHKDGTYRSLEGTGTNLLDEPGVNAIVLNYRDVTARIDAEAALRASEARTRSMLAGIDAGVIVHGPDLRITSFNPKAMEILGVTAEQMANRDQRDTLWSRVRVDGSPIAPEDLPAHRALATRQPMREVILGFERVARGDFAWVMASANPVLGPSGEVAEVIVSFVDVSARIRAEEALRVSEARFKALFEQAAVGVALTEVATGSFVQANRRFCAILDYRWEELRQMTFAAVTHPEDINGSVEMMQRLAAGAQREATWEKRYLRRDGATIWVTLTVSPMWAPGDAPTACIAVVQDITARKELEGHLRQAQKMDALGTLAGGIAHDFNNILASIKGYTELALLVLRENPNVRDHLGAVQRAANRAIALVRQILAFSRQQNLERRPIALQPLVEEALKLLRATIPVTVEFEAVLAGDAPPVLADATQIHQVLMNLGTNAWHAMADRPGRLQVRLDRCEVGAVPAAAPGRLRPGTYARLSVRDSGRGMDAETLRRIFEPFFTTKPPGEGTGLGLAMVHGIMESHEGAVTVSSQPGEGTTFQLYFPAHHGRAEPAPDEGGPIPRGQGQRILFVDDEEWLVQLAQETLTMLGYAVEVATTPALALERVRAEPGHFALVFTDLTMPGMTGLDLARALRALRPDLPVILMTGYSAALTAERLEAAGVRQLLLKPIALPALGAAAHAALRPAD